MIGKFKKSIDIKEENSFVFHRLKVENKELQKDIRKKQEEISRIQKRYQVLIRESNDIYAIISFDGTIRYISEVIENILGYKDRDCINKKIYDFFSESEQKKIKNMIDFVMVNTDEIIKEDLIIRAKSDRKVFLETQMHNLLEDPEIKGIVVKFIDITKRKGLERRITYYSSHDELTGLPNNTFFKILLEKRYQLALEAKAEFGLMILYVDGLDYIKYSLGYEIENKLIIKVVERIKGFLGKDTIIGKYSEDHFAIIIENLINYGEYESIAKGLIELCSDPYIVDAYELEVSFNIGIQIYNKKTQSVTKSINQALDTLLRARREGKNNYKFYLPSIDIQNYKEFLLRSDLRKSIKQEQFKIHYQPMVSLNTSEIIAAEALIRWEHPEWGLIPPSEFISLAEETGHIIEIGNWMLRQVCKNYSKWLQEGLPNIKISINFSSIQFLQNEFEDTILNIIHEFDLDPHFLIMEITESIYMEKAEKIISSIQVLQSHGIQVALDDFGTGYSSLAYLKDFQLDILKIDGSFIINIPKDHRSSVLTKNIVNMAKELKIKVVAERIESWEQLSFLKEINCYAGQGYLYSKPVDQDKFEKLLTMKYCKPRISDILETQDRRKDFRVEFPYFIEGDVTILEIKGKKINVGKTKILIKNLGPGGLCFIANVKLPVEKAFVLQFTSKLLKEEIKLQGYTVWREETSEKLNEYGVEFIISKNNKRKLTELLEQTEEKMKDKMEISNNLVADSPVVYFKTKASYNE